MKRWESIQTDVDPRETTTEDFELIQGLYDALGVDLSSGTTHTIAGAGPVSIVVRDKETGEVIDVDQLEIEAALNEPVSASFIGRPREPLGWPGIAGANGDVDPSHPAVGLAQMLSGKNDRERGDADEGPRSGPTRIAPVAEPVAVDEDGGGQRIVQRYTGQMDIVEEYGVDQLSDVDQQGTWIEDPREKEEPWRSRFCLTQCTGVDDGVRCQVKVRGSDRCAVHKRWCEGKTRKGTDCEAPPLKDFGFCINHVDQADPVEYAEYKARQHSALDTAPEHGSPEWHAANWGSAAQAAEAGKLGGQARRYPRLYEEMQRQIEESAAEIVAAGLDATRATKPVVVEIQERDAHGRTVMHQEIHEYPDHFVRLKAHETLANRAFGRPHQAVDVNQETRELKLTIDARDPEVRDQLHSFLRRRPDVDT